MAVTYVGRCAALVLAAVVVCSFTFDPNTIRCPASQPFGYIRDPGNCSVYYRCVFGEVTRMRACGPGTVFSTHMNICVLPGSSLDNCVHFENNEVLNTQTNTIRCPASQPFGYVRDPDNCSVYYRCVFGKVIRMGACGPETVFSTHMNICVLAGSSLDNCVDFENNEGDQQHQSAQDVPLTELSPIRRCVRKDQAFPHPTECGLFYNCSLVCEEWSKKFLELMLDQCPPSQWFNSDTMMCEDAASVNCGSRRETEYPYAPPILTPEGLSPQEACDRGATVFPHPLYCNAYYNCSHVHPVYKLQKGRFIEQYLLECSYPNFFSAETLKCENFANVSCGSRKETKNFCEYRGSLCEQAHCRPCWSRSAVCENIQDGPHYMECQAFNPMYAECKNERLIDIPTCKQGELFSPLTSQCVDGNSVPEDVKGIYGTDLYYTVKDMKRQG